MYDAPNATEEKIFIKLRDREVGLELGKNV